MENRTTTPVFAHEDLLEDAFKTPVVDEEGRSESLPTIWNDYSYGETEEKCQDCQYALFKVSR